MPVDSDTKPTPAHGRPWDWGRERGDPVPQGAPGGWGRWFDVIASSAGLLVLWPVFALVALAILILSGRPIFFRQERAGLHGRSFRIWKFRSMRAEEAGASDPLVTAAGDARITRLGGWLRAFKVDELPQLMNVLVGDMSIIGPRPEVWRYVDLREPVWQTVLSVRPGITDLATLAFVDEEHTLAGHLDPEACYRQKLLPAKLALNVSYLKRRSRRTDIQLILLTLRQVTRLGKPARGWIDDLLGAGARTSARESA
ncbi:MAG TPA: sugar transferase [Bryobacteraceae bacterium]|nr:sugar transferase [Bryobacteraceae bacterium]